MMSEIKKLKVASLQLVCQDGDIKANIQHATPFIKEVSKQGAKVVLLPELYTTGYILNESAWELAEPKGGITETWLMNIAKECGIYVGTSYLEADGEDFFNTFCLANPNGEVSGRVRKEHAGFTETYIFKGDKNTSHIINTKIGKIAVGICYDNAFCFMYDAVQKNDADFMLWPMSAPTPPYSEKEKKAYHEAFKDGVHELSKATGIPYIMANKSGKWKSELPSIFPAMDSSYPGFSAIADSDGVVQTRLGSEEGMIIQDITLDPSKKVKTKPKCYGENAGPVPFFFKLWKIIEFFGRRSYKKSQKRKELALKISRS